MKLVFVDSDILLDSILIRDPFFEFATKLLAITNNKNITFCTSFHSLLNVHYLAKKFYGEILARQSINELIKRLRIISEDCTLLVQALTSESSDFEDAVQYHAAVHAGAEVIVTRNIKDYKQSAIPILTAEQFLNSYQI